MNLYIATIAYNKFSILEQSLLSLIENSTYKNKKHILIDNLYPNENPDKLKDFCLKNNIEYLCFNKNIGLFNAMYEIQELYNEDDYIILHEGNNLILDKGFDEAMIETYEELKDDNLDVLVTLSNEFSYNLKKIKKNNIIYSIENDGDKSVTNKPKGFPFGGTNLTNKRTIKRASTFYKDVYFFDPYITYPREQRMVYILRSHREISHNFYKDEDIEYKLYKMLTIFVKYKKTFEEFLILKENNIEYIYMLISVLNKRILKYIGYEGKLK